MIKRISMVTSLLPLLGILSIMLIGCSSQPLTKEETGNNTTAHETIDIILKLNQEGKRDEAAGLGEDFLSSNPDAETNDKCQVYSHMAYAYSYIKNFERAREIIGYYDQECSDLPDSLLWLENEMTNLKIELGLSEETQDVQDLSPEEEAISKILKLNQAGERDKASELAEDFLITFPDAKTIEKCQVYHHLAYACTNTNKIERAKEIVGYFDQECSEALSSMTWLEDESAKLKIDLGLVEEQYVPPADDFWESVDGASLGLDIEVLARHQAWCEETGADGCMIVYMGKIVQEWYSKRYRLPMYAMSSTKSVAGLLTGMLIDDGKIPSVDEPVCSFLEEWCTGDKAKVTLRHVLSMTIGFERMQGEKSVGSKGDKNQYVIGLPLTFEPGTEWVYSNEGSQLLSPILDKAAGEPIQDYARKRLFESLGMQDTQLNIDQAGHAWLYADMKTSLRDFARLGILMLNQGQWDDQQIVSAGWIAQSTISSQDLNSGYGLHWWLIDDPKGYQASGHLNTDLYVFPEMDLIVVRMQRNVSDIPEGTYKPEALRMFKEMLNN